MGRPAMGRSVTLLLVNIWVFFAVFFANAITSHHYQAMDVELPNLTLLALGTGIVWPIAALVVSIVGLFLALWQVMKERALTLLFHIVALAELVLFGLHIVALLMPMANCFYSMD